MAESDFKHTTLSRIGSFLHWLLGPSTTSVTQGPIKTRTLSIPSDDTDEWPKATVICTRIVYRTSYKRRWVPAVHRTLYEVSIIVPPEVLAKYGQAHFQTTTYPLLCNRLLEWTTYPHICAILAYLDTLLDALKKPRL